ncbi:MAG: sugar ABC transporter permease, partial [Chloroflexota bacterium]|nr:sugar ABC transporter permease [Chloroflexota bacterium]
MSTMANDPRLIQQETGSAVGNLRRRLSYADLGQLPVLIGLVLIWLVFQSANSNFLSPVNLTNLMLQIVAVGITSVGIILVLLLGEIDLSVGAVSGLTASIMAVQNVKNGLPGPVAVLLAILAGVVIGLIHGFWITKLRVPAFIVTLAGLLGWQGVQLLVLGNTGTINLRDPFLTGLTLTFYPGLAAWIAAGVFILLYAVGSFWEREQRAKGGLTATSRAMLAARVVAVAIGVLIATAVFNADRGLPLGVIIFVVIIVLFNTLTKRTTFGRHLYAVGGNAEAARRASINVDNIRIAVFALCSMLAAVGGVMAGSRLLAVNQSSGGSDFLLNSIAAAVIGGTSLFGGRGTVWAALIGAVVIGSISNGMDLLALQSPVKFMITGAVLLAAVTIDALVRRR